MHVEIVKGNVCNVCGAPVGKMIDRDGELLGYACYGKNSHIRDATNEERKEHNREKVA